MATTMKQMTDLTDTTHPAWRASSRRYSDIISGAKPGLSKESSLRGALGARPGLGKESSLRGALGARPGLRKESSLRGFLGAGSGLRKESSFRLDKIQGLISQANEAMSALSDHGISAITKPIMAKDLSQNQRQNQSDHSTPWSRPSIADETLTIHERVAAACTNAAEARRRASQELSAGTSEAEKFVCSFRSSQSCRVVPPPPYKPGSASARLSRSLTMQPDAPRSDAARQSARRRSRRRSLTMAGSNLEVQVTLRRASTERVVRSRHTQSVRRNRTYDGNTISRAKEAEKEEEERSADQGKATRVARRRSSRSRISIPRSELEQTREVKRNMQSSQGQELRRAKTDKGPARTSRRSTIRRSKSAVTRLPRSHDTLERRGSARNLLDDVPEKTGTFSRRSRGVKNPTSAETRNKQSMSRPTKCESKAGEPKSTGREKRKRTSIRRSHSDVTELANAFVVSTKRTLPAAA